jgi:outer membrane protein insertion porin family
MAASVHAQDEQVAPIIGDIQVVGGATLTSDTVSYYLGVEPGDPLDDKILSEGFHQLWESGLVEDARIEAEPMENDEVRLIVTVQERPFVTSVVFEGNKKLSTSSLKDRLDERGIDVPRNVPLRLAQLSRIQTALKEVYEEDGYRSAEVTFKVEDAGANKKRVEYTVDEGGKVKIDEIDFVGNEVFSDSRLLRPMKKVKEVRFYRPWGKKIIYSEAGWQEDKENLRDYYRNHGYKDVKIGTPELDMYAKNPNADTLKDQKYRVKVTIPVEEGEPYTVGSLKVTGTTVYPSENLATIFEIQEGDRYSYKIIDDGIQKIQDIYQNSGYIYAYASPSYEDRTDADHVTDVVVDVFEGDRFHLGRLEFSGNTATKDKVLRREFRIAEGSYMNMGALKSSVFKVNALGYWKLEEEPLDFEFDDENKKVNVTVKGNEVGRNDVQFGAGYSELDGVFAQAQFNTRNFLGRGNTLGVSVQAGRRADYYTLSFTEPYLFDRRILLGASVFKTSLDIDDFYRETTGASLTTGFGVGIFSSVSALVSWEDVTSRYSVSRVGTPGTAGSGHVRPGDLPPITYTRPELAFERFDGRTAAITPAYNFDSRDDPFDPNRGQRFTLRTKLAGGPFGGDFDYIRPEVQWSEFMPLSKRTGFAFNLEGGQFYPYNGSEIPFYERYRLGGDRSLRGIPYYTVLPRDAEGNYFTTEAGSRVAGDRYWVVNLEYQIRVGGPVKLVLFGDAGNTYHEDQGWDLGLYRKTTGIELRIFLPIFQAPIRFIYGYNLDPFPEEDQSDFQFSIGTTF